MDPNMFEGKKFIVLSTSNVVGGINYTTFLVFILLFVLLTLSSLTLIFISKRNVQIRELAISVREKHLQSSLEESPSMISALNKDLNSENGSLTRTNATENLAKQVL
jgi:hypothetical protein